jgi:hypothetical protein
MGSCGQGIADDSSAVCSMETTMSAFRRRWLASDGDIRCNFWSAALARKRLGQGRDSSGRRLVKCRAGRLLF